MEGESEQQEDFGGLGIERVEGVGGWLAVVFGI